MAWSFVANLETMYGMPTARIMAVPMTSMCPVLMSVVMGTALMAVSPTPMSARSRAACG